MITNYAIANDVRGTVIAKCDAIITHIDYLINLLRDYHAISNTDEEHLNDAASLIENVRQGWIDFNPHDVM